MPTLQLMHLDVRHQPRLLHPLDRIRSTDRILRTPNEQIRLVDHRPSILQLNLRLLLIVLPHGAIPASGGGHTAGFLLVDELGFEGWVLGEGFQGDVGATGGDEGAHCAVGAEHLLHPGVGFAVDGVVEGFEIGVHDGAGAVWVREEFPVGVDGVADGLFCEFVYSVEVELGGRLVNGLNGGCEGKGHTVSVRGGMKATLRVMRPSMRGLCRR